VLLLENAIEVLKGNFTYARIMGDYLTDVCQDKAGVNVYIHRLSNENPRKLRMQTVIDTVINYGTKIERKIMSKMYRLVLRKRYPHSKKVTLIFMKKRWSLHRTWSARTELTQLLELSFKARFPDPKSGSLTVASS
jgi:hypothetical protein